MSYGFGWRWLGLVVLMPAFLLAAQTDPPVVRAVMFYSRTCPHCHQVIAEDLPPLMETYGDQLQVVGVDTQTPGGQELFRAAIQQFEIPPDRQAVPMLIVGDAILLGSLEIPEMFPGLIEWHLSHGGVDWPNIPGLREALPTPPPEATAAEEQVAPAERSTEPVATEEATPLPAGIGREATPPPNTPGSNDLDLLGPDPLEESWVDRLLRDPIGNTLSVLVLIGMLVSIVAVPTLLLKRPDGLSLQTPPAAVLVLSIVGLIVAGYLAYVETAQVEAVCGPVGDCNTVQQSEYADLFGVLPVGVLGLVGYSLIGVLWFFSRLGRGRVEQIASTTILVVTFIGTLYSAYLTFLEPFVIGATCAWCLSSAVIMTALLWLSANPGRLSERAVRRGRG